MRITKEQLKQIVKEELETVMSEKSDVKGIARMVANSIGRSYGGRPPKEQKDLNPGEYHAFYLARRLSLTGDLKKAKSYYDSVMRNVTDENERRDFNDKLKTLKAIINPDQY